ncbi:GtrA family protein [Falsirhodobacter deserti]|uniref:GtrA family protein n=1 Tax=Falsirhodobacter deserti TaxID=1365611 RepID=UPI000FE3E519|nr:GtrA family protein [Falsirhodobacter deserti]
MTARLRHLVGSDALSGRFARYLFVGGSAAIVDLGGFVLLIQAGYGTAAAAAASFAFAAVYNFTLSSSVVFRTGSTWRRFVMFMALALVGVSVNTGVTTLAATWLPEVLAKVAGIGMAFGLNFWMNNTIVFRRA